MGTETRAYTLEKFFQAAIAGEKAVAVWRQPNTTTVHACAQLSAGYTTGQPRWKAALSVFFFALSRQLHHSLILLLKQKYIFRMAA
ncbi:hypothetical protein GCM10028895_15160 [Pontibacter rugosus]